MGHDSAQRSWTAGAIEIPCGELTGDLRTAWLRGVLLELFGPGTATFDYELEATVDGESTCSALLTKSSSVGPCRFNAAVMFSPPSKYRSR